METKLYKEYLERLQEDLKKYKELEKTDYFCMVFNNIFFKLKFKSSPAALTLDACQRCVFELDT